MPTAPRTSRALTAAGLCLALLAGATACQGSASGGAASRAHGSAVAGKVDFTWWGSGTRSARTEAVIDLFQRAHPQATVAGQSMDFGGYWEKLNVQAAGGNLPCVPQMQARQLGDYTRHHTLLPLDNLVKKGVIDVSGIPKSVLDTGRGQDGKLYMIPNGAAYDGVMYNRGLAKKAGLPSPPKEFDWDWYTRWLRKASRRLPEGKAATNLDGGKPDLFISYAQSHGQDLFRGRKLGFSKKLLAGYWRMWEKLRRDGATLPASEQAEVPNAIEQNPVSQGRTLAGSMPGNSVEAAQSTLDGVDGGHVTVAPHPTGPKGLGNVLITSGLSISATCDNTATAAKFIDFFTNDPEAAKAYASDNGAVTDKGLLDQQLADPHLPAQKRQWLHVYEQIVKQSGTAVKYPPGYHFFEEAFLRYHQNVAFGRQTVREAVDAFFSDVEGELQQ